MDGLLAFGGPLNGAIIPLEPDRAEVVAHTITGDRGAYLRYGRVRFCCNDDEWECYVPLTQYGDPNEAAIQHVLDSLNAIGQLCRFIKGIDGTVMDDPTAQTIGRRLRHFHGYDMVSSYDAETKLLDEHRRIHRLLPGIEHTHPGVDRA